MLYLMNALEYDNTLVYVALCGLYTMGAAMVFPALDGMTNEFLERSDNPEEDLARERLYGAVLWALMNLYMSAALDWYGFYVTYPMAACSAVAVLVSVCIYSYKQRDENDEEATDAKGSSTNKIEREIDKLEMNEIKRSFYSTHDADGDSHGNQSDAATEATAPTHQGSDTEEASSISEHGGSDVCSMTEGTFGNEHGHEASSGRSGGTNDGRDAGSIGASSRAMSSSIGTADRSGMDSSVLSVSERSASTFLLERKPSSRKPRKTTEKSKSMSDASYLGDDNTISDDETKDYKEELNLGEEYLMVFLAMCSSCYGCAFLFLYLCISAGQAIVDNLIFLYFETMGASYLLMGYTIVITIGLELSVSYIAPSMVCFPCALNTVSRCIRSHLLALCLLQQVDLRQLQFLAGSRWDSPRDSTYWLHTHSE
jgi:MFS_1 like family